MKQIIRLTESDLHRIIKESVHKILKETRLDYDEDNFSGKYTKTKTDDYINQDDLSASKLRYINNRLGTNLTYNDIIKLF